MKKYLSLVLLAGLLLSGCSQKTTTTSTQANKTESQKKAEYKKFTKEFKKALIVENQNYSNNLTGNWNWIAYKAGKPMGEGSFQLKDIDKQLRGNVRIMAMVKPFDGGPQRVAFINYPIDGMRQNEKNLYFSTMARNGQSLMNTASINENGTEMKGKTTDSRIVNGKRVELSYEWTAKRVTSDLVSLN